MSSRGNDPVKAKEIQNKLIKDNYPSDYQMADKQQEMEYGRMSSGELYRNMINSNSQSGSSGGSNPSSKLSFSNFLIKLYLDV